MRGFKQKQQAAKALDVINIGARKLVNEQRAKLYWFAGKKGGYMELKQGELLPAVHKELAQDIYAILNQALKEFGLKAPDKAMMKNLKYIVDNKEAIGKAMKENGLDDTQVQKVISVSKDCINAMDDLWDRAGKAAKILVEEDIKNQKAITLIDQGMALAMMAIVSAMGVIAGIVFTGVALASGGGMLPLGLLFANLLLGPALVTSFVVGAATRMHDSGAVNRDPDVEGHIADLIINKTNHFIHDAKALESVIVQLGKISDKLEGVPSALQTAFEQSKGITR